MKRTKEDTSTVEASKITVDYKNKRITITPPKYKRDWLGRITKFTNEFIYTWILILFIFVLTYFGYLSWFNDQLDNKFEVTYTGEVKYVIYKDPQIPLTIFKISAIAAVIFAILTKGILFIGNAANRGMTVSQRPRYYLKIKTTDGLKEWKTPIFLNCCLFYEATGDFGKYLQKIKIRKYPIKRIYKIKNKFLRKILSLPNPQYWWQGTFIFREIPRKGYLEIKYK